MGYAMEFQACLICRLPFGFNPVRVPSWEDENGIRRPICKQCIDKINAKRIEIGNEPIPFADDAYEAVSEWEL